MENAQMKSVQGASPMVGGDGPQSYAQNSIYQKSVVHGAKGLMSEGIRAKLDFENSYFFNNSTTTFRIADLGCSTGPNTFFAVENIIEAVEEKYRTQLQNSSPVEFQVFFNDFNGNDFNTLFNAFPSYQKYFAAGVPGSFYARLFPKSSIHFAHSSLSLHWLSRVPPEIVDRKSPAWNKGSIQCTGFSKEVADAYLAQFKNDFVTFLNARAEEIVGGGLMVILIASRPNGVLMSETSTGIFYDALGSCLNDMANLGEISEEMVDSFNLPLYYPHPKELEDIIKENGHFSIETMEEMINPVMSTKPKMAMSISSVRAAFEGLLKDHFGNKDIVNKIFQHFTNQLAKTYSTVGQGACYSIEMFILLKRNIN